VEILRRRIHFEQSPEQFEKAYAAAEEGEARRIIRARQLYPLVRYTDKDLYTIASLTASFRVDGHRADIVILRTARAQAAYDGRDAISDRDILLAAELALPHRMKKQPFQESVLNADQLQNNMRQARADAERNVPEDGENQQEQQEGAGSSDPKNAARAMRAS